MIKESQIAAALRSEADQISPSPALLQRIQAAAQAQPQPWYRKLLRRSPRRRFALSVAGVAAALLLVTTLLPTLLTPSRNLVYAMERSVAALRSYHGVMANGQTFWFDGERLRVEHPDGTIWVRGAEHEWYLDPHQRLVIQGGVGSGFSLWSGFLPRVAELALTHPHRILGDELIAGRLTTKIEIDLRGGIHQYIWIDKESHLPLQWGTPDRLEGFVRFEINPAIPESLFTLTVPEGFTLDERKQWIVGPEEAAAVAGFPVLLPTERPTLIRVTEEAVQMEFPAAQVIQYPAQEPMAIRGTLAYGSAAGSPLAYNPEAGLQELEWQQDGIVVIVRPTAAAGDRWLDLARQIAPDLKLPDANQDLVSRAQVKVAIDLPAVQALQDRVDRGDNLGPSLCDAWNQANIYALDHLGASIPLHSQVIANSGAQAVVAFEQGPVARIYLQRLIRPGDIWSIWTVVGYDPR